MQKESKKESMIVVEPEPKRFPWNLVLIIAIIAVILIILITVSILAYNYLNSLREDATERSLEVDSNIQQAIVYNESICMLSLVDAINISNIKTMKFVFENKSYPTSEFKQDYEINTSDLGLENFKEIKKVIAEIEYYTITNPPINGTLPSTNATLNCTDGIKNGDEKGVDCGGSCKACGGPGPSGPGCTAKTCSYYYSLSQCGTSLSNGCANTLSCTSCTNGTCSSGACIQLPSCTSDDNCTSFTGACGTGLCNLILGSCYVNYLTGNICRNNVSECDAVETCQNEMVNCPNDANKTDGTTCTGGSCTNGRCIALICGDGICVSGENCPADAASCSDNTCYEPACANGCGQAAVALKGNDEGCLLPKYCNGVGSCVKCINNGDCGVNESCVSGNCVNGTNQKYTLTIIAANGTVIMEPDIAGSYDANSIIYLNPLPNQGYSFDYWAGDVENDAAQLVGKVTMTSNKVVTAHFVAWHAPIGIPTPDFGIFESYRMYDDLSNRNLNLTYYASPDAGFYTDYVDYDDPNATDDSNAHGSVSKPRKTIPLPLEAGSIVEIHHRSNPLSLAYIGGIGTATKPIFIRGVNLPILGPNVGGSDQGFAVGYYYNAQYIIIEGLRTYKARVYGTTLFPYQDTAYISVRNCDIRGDLNGGGAAIVGIDANSYADHIVFYANHIHDGGIWDPLLAEDDRDYGTLVVTGYTKYSWIIDNVMDHGEGDGVQINAGSQTLMPTLHHIYLGRNIAHHNKQSGFWTKQSQDTIFSQNTAYRMRASTSAPGAGFGFQLNPERVWFLFNTVFDCEYGFTLDSNSGGTDHSVYFIGNLIYDIQRDQAYHGSFPYIPTEGGAWINSGIMCVGGHFRYLIGNTLFNCSAGMNFASSGHDYLADNIISAIGDLGESHIWVEDPGGNVEWYAINNLFYQQGGSARIKWQNTVYNASSLPSPYGINNVDANPLFVNAGSDFRLQPGSFAIDNGTNADFVDGVFNEYATQYGIDIRKDIEGRARPIDGDNNGSAEWDIGAYEYQNGSLPTLPVALTEKKGFLNWLKSWFS